MMRRGDAGHGVTDEHPQCDAGGAGAIDNPGAQVAPGQDGSRAEREQQKRDIEALQRAARFFHRELRRGLHRDGVTLRRERHPPHARQVERRIVVGHTAARGDQRPRRRSIMKPEVVAKPKRLVGVDAGQCPRPRGELRRRKRVRPRREHG